MTTVSAAVSVMPWPPARVDSRKTKPSDPSAAGSCRVAVTVGLDNCYDLSGSQVGPLAPQHGGQQEDMHTAAPQQRDRRKVVH